jgi:iron complex outermembrane recepter protein
LPLINLTRTACVSAARLRLLLPAALLAYGPSQADTLLAQATTTPAQTVTVTGARERTGTVTQTLPATVGKSPVPIQETPFSISAISVEQAREQGAQNIQDALLYSAGVYAGRYGFDTRGDWAAVRGLGPSTYLDGLRSLFGFYNTVRPDINTLASIEVLKGPASVLYGQAELGGIVNAVSKRPALKPMRELELQLGSFSRRQLAADFTGPLNADGSLRYRLVALARKSDTQVDFVNDDALVLMPALSWQPRPGTSLTATLLAQRNEAQVSAQFLPSKGTLEPAPLGRISASRFAGEPGYDRYDQRKDEMGLLLEHTLSERWKLNATTRKTRSGTETREIWATVGAIPTDAGNITRTVHSADRATEVDALDARIEGQLALGPTRHTLAVGIDWQNAFWQEFNYFNQTGVGSLNLYAPVYGNVGSLNLSALPLVDRPDNKIRQLGLYATNHVTWGPWVGSLALRADRAKNSVLPVAGAPTTASNSERTGRAGLMFRFGFGLSAYASVSSAFVPNLGTDGTPAAGFLKPTTGTQKELGLKFLAPDGQTAVNAAWFDIEQKNRIVDGATPGGREQVGATVKGWEVELRHRIGGLELSANYADLEALNTITQKRLSSIAEKAASAWAQYRVAGGWRVGAGARITGSVTGNAGVPVLPSVTLYDLMLGYEVAGLDLRLDVKNAADKLYVSWCRGLNQDCGYGEVRRVALTARYRF